ncbi:hypothetical protein D3C87_1543250 [compost metagenome]
MGQLDVQTLGQHFDDEVRGIAFARRGKIQGFRTGAGHLGQVIQRARAGLLAGDQQEGRVDQQADTLEVPRRLIGQVFVHMRVERQVRNAADQHGVAVGRLLGDIAGCQDAVGAWPVLDHHGRLELARHVVGPQAADDVGAATRRLRHDQLDRLIRIGRVGTGDKQARKPGGGAGARQ